MSASAAISRDQSERSPLCSLALSPSVSHVPAPSDDFADDLESYMIAMETSAYEDGPSGVPPSPTFTLRTPRPAESNPEEEEEEGAVPGTPPHKKVWGGHRCAWGQGDGKSPLLTPTSPLPTVSLPVFWLRVDAGGAQPGPHPGGAGRGQRWRELRALSCQHPHRVTP